MNMVTMETLREGYRMSSKANHRNKAADKCETFARSAAESCLVIDQYDDLFAMMNDLASLLAVRIGDTLQFVHRDLAGHFRTESLNRRSISTGKYPHLPGKTNPN